MVEAELCNTAVNLFFRLGFWTGFFITLLAGWAFMQLSDYFRNKKLLLLIKNTDDKKIFCIATGLKYKEDK